MGLAERRAQIKIPLANMHKPIWILNRSSTMIIVSAIANSKKIFKLNHSPLEFEEVEAVPDGRPRCTRRRTAASSAL